MANYDKQFANRAQANSIFIDTIKALSDVGQERNHTSSVNALAVICSTRAQLQQAQSKAQYLIYKPEFINSQTIKEARECNAFLDLPSFSDNNYLHGLLLDSEVGVVCHNVGHVGLARKLRLPYVAGSGLNIYNDFIAREFSDAQTFVYSLELTLNEISEFINQSGLVFVDGTITLMKLVHCPYKLNFKCDCSSCQATKQLTYTDELGNSFNVVRRKDRRCTFELQNGKKLSIVSKMKHGWRFLIDFDSRVVNHYLSLNNGIDDGYVETVPYTKGRLFDKVN